MAAAAEQRALGARLDDDVADEPREPDVVGPDGEQHEVELALGIGAACPGQGIAQLGHLRACGVGTGRGRTRAGAFDNALAAEKACADGRAGAGERQVGDGDMRALDRQHKRGAQLIAVERAVARAAFPACALPRPARSIGIVAGVAFARPVAAIAVAAGAEILARIATQEAAIAEAFVGEPHGAIRIAFAGRNRIAHAGDENIAHRDVGHDPLGGAVRQRDIDRCVGRLAIGDADSHLVVTGDLGLPRLAGAVLEAPLAAHVRRQRAGEHDADRVVAWREIVLARAVAIAALDQPSAAIDAQALHDVAGPAAAIAADFQPALGAEHAVVTRRGDVTLEVGLAAEQAEAVFDLPLDAGGGGAGGNSALSLRSRS